MEGLHTSPHVVPTHTPGAHEKVNSGGQSGPVPVHTPGRMATFLTVSQLAARHAVPPGWYFWAGHAPLTPSHFSATSHTPALARQMVPPLSRLQVPVTSHSMQSVTSPEPHAEPQHTPSTQYPLAQSAG